MCCRVAVRTLLERSPDLSADMKPILLHYFVTTRCNSRCVFCDIWKGPHLPDAAAADVNANLAACRRAGCRFADFTGGEPLLNRDLPEFLKAAKKLGFITSVTTNCLLFPERAAELAGLVDLLHFSIDADTAALHDALRGVPSYDSVLRSIDAGLENRLVPDLLFTYSDRNISALEGVYRLACERKLMLVLDPVFHTDGPDRISAATHERAKSFAKRPGVYLNRALVSLREAGGNDSESPICRAVDSSIVILPDNTLALPCFHHRLDIVPVKNDLAAVLHGSVRSEASRMQGRYQFCQGCHINCYFDPSFSFMRNRFFFESMAAKLRYSFRKYLVYRRPWPSVFSSR